jgi:ribosomal protein S18 acetylase RimI-like enzyme
VATALARRADPDAVPVSGLEERIQAAIRADAVRSRDVVEVGPFVATFTPGSPNPFLNYAIPIVGARPTADDIASLGREFDARARRPRLEYLPALAPEVEPALLVQRYAVELRTPLMTCAEVTAAGEPDGIEVRLAESDDDIRSAANAQDEAYGEPGSADDARVARVRESLEAGGLLVLARDRTTGEPAGGGACTPPHDGATELAGVGVRPAYRRRGIAAAVTALLAGTMLDRGVATVFLMAAGDGEARIYERVGFARIGEVLHISRPA